ncbi:MAG: transposase [Kiritimatiellales bacterium]
MSPLRNTVHMGRASSPSEPLLERKKLPHEVPAWVNQGERYFITVNCKYRGQDGLPRKADYLLGSARYYEQIGKWYLWLMVIMPDHIHFIATFDLSQGLRNTVSSWKRYQAKAIQIEWQSDFFEHRLRNQSEFDEKCHYIRMNPVRKGLVKNPTDWPHLMDRAWLDNGSLGELALPKPDRKEPV